MQTALFENWCLYLELLAFFGLELEKDMLAISKEQ